MLRYELLSEQAEDGSFGDLLGTYSVIPALLNRSLADLQCKTRKYKGKLVHNFECYFIQSTYYGIGLFRRKAKIKYFPRRKRYLAMFSKKDYFDNKNNTTDVNFSMRVKKKSGPGLEPDIV